MKKSVTRRAALLAAPHGRGHSARRRIAFTASLMCTYCVRPRLLDRGKFY